MDGFFLIDKEKGMTSFDVVRDVRRICGEKKVGHSGTLDKSATGLLLLAVGQGTKMLEYLIGCDKEYEVVGRFGYVSDTYDADGEIKKTDFEGKIDKKVVLDAMKRFVGEISQLPPKYSALKVGGKRASDRVRNGEEVVLKERDITIYGFEVVEFDWPEVKFRVKCSSGTYIRSLINDLGAELECGAYVVDLRRTKIRDFAVEGGVKTVELSKKVEQRLVSVEGMAKSFSVFELSGEDFEDLKDGRVLLGKKVEQGVVVGFLGGKAVGVLENVDGGIKYEKVFH